jgi:hypothetical protein
VTSLPPVPGDRPDDVPGPNDAPRSADVAGPDATDATADAIGDASTDDVLARVRAADPAADVHADLPALRGAVAARAAVDAGATGAPGETGEPVPGAPAASVTELDAAREARRTRRPARWLQVAAAVAGVAVIGSGGYAVGRGDTPTPAAAPISLDGASTGRAAQSPVAPGLEQMSAADSAQTKMIAPWFGGRTVFTGAGLSTDAGSAQAWTFDPASVFSQATAERLAGVLGVAGAAVEQWGGWAVGPQDGTGPNLQLQPDGLASVSYYDPTRDPWACVRSAPDTLDGTAPDAGSAEEPATGGLAGAAEPSVVDPGIVEPVPCLDDGAPPPSGDAASAQARDLLGSLGVDADGYELEVATDTGQPASTTVYAHQVLGGQRTGVTWSMTFVADGIQSLYGSLAPVVELGEYDVISPADAVARLMDVRFGASSGMVMPLADGMMRAATEDADGATEELVAPDPAVPTVPPVAEPGSPISWPVQEVTLVEARLGLAMITQADGSSVLVPSYELTDADGSTWSVVAVVEDQLDFATP